MPVQGQGQLDKALIQLSLTNSDVVVSREVMGHGRSVCLSKMLGFGPPLSHGSVVSGYFPSILPRLAVTIRVSPVSPMARQGLTHSSSKGKEAQWGSASGFPCAMGCSLVLPAMVNCEKIP